MGRKHKKTRPAVAAPARPSVIKYVDPETKYAEHPRYYVGYGSNHNVVQMQARCPRSMPVLAGMMPDHRLVFSGVLTVEPKPGEKVPVSIWHVTPSDIAALDRYEGFPHLYSKRYTHVTVAGERVEAFYYVLNPPYRESAPSDAYYDTCAEGYDDFALDIHYLEAARDRAVLADEARKAEMVACELCGEKFPAGEMAALGRGKYRCAACTDYLEHAHEYWGRDYKKWWADALIID